MLLLKIIIIVIIVRKCKSIINVRMHVELPHFYNVCVFLTPERSRHSKTSDITSLMKQQKEQFSDGYRPSATSHSHF